MPIPNHSMAIGKIAIPGSGCKIAKTSVIISENILPENASIVAQIAKTIATKSPIPIICSENNVM